jgi:hypothetical protein
MEIGRLNLLTPTRVAAAGKEIRTGEIVPVKYVYKIGMHYLVQLQPD